jgi:hypothetical protein
MVPHGGQPAFKVQAPAASNRNVSAHIQGLLDGIKLTHTSYALDRSSRKERTVGPFLGNH